MKEVSDLDSRLPVREHLRNTKKVLKMVNELDHFWLPFCLARHLLQVTNGYLALILSAYILDAIGGGAGYWQICKVTVCFCVGMFLLGNAASFLHLRTEARKAALYARYHTLTEEKMLGMDFARINSPECEVLKRRIRDDLNWSSGIYSVFGSLDEILHGVLNLVGAVAVGFPVVGLVFGSGKSAVWLVLVLAVAVSAVTTCMGTRFMALYNQCLNRFADTMGGQVPFLGWAFANGSQFCYQNGMDVRIYGSCQLMKRYALDNGELPEDRMTMRKISGYLGKSRFCQVLSGQLLEGAAFILVGILALAGAVTVGNVLRYAGCIRNLFGELDGLAKTVPELFLNIRKHMSTMELLELENVMYKGSLPLEKRRDGEYRIEFRNVSFRYPGSGQYALKDFSMKLRVGEKLAIVGRNGSGKTTMIKLLSRLYDPQEGEILLNGVDIRKFRQEEYLKLFSVVFQDFKLFSLPLGENVAAACRYDQGNVVRCLEDAGFGERLHQMEEGTGTYLYKDYEDGVEISGGEAQKIAIARAVCKDAPFVLLDEPTAALDPLSEYEIYTGFDRIVGDKTAIYISHRLSSCRFCERIAVFQEGQVVQMGSHEELLQEEGVYRELWEAQAQYYRSGKHDTESRI